MCGRFALNAPASKVAEVFGVVAPEDMKLRFNVAPTDQVLGIRAEPARTAKMYRWGLVPYWSDPKKKGPPLINARVENVATSGSFRVAFEKRRLLVPASGFYEWEKVGKERRPVYFTPADHGLFALAGLWEHWFAPDGGTLESCAVITVPANDLVGRLHDRMPAILPKEAWDAWLDPATPPETALKLLEPLPVAAMVAERVPPLVNSVKNDVPACVIPTGEPY